MTIKAMILAASAVLALSAVSVTAAQAETWTLHWIGPKGGVYEGGGKCINGVCESSGTFTGPYGGVWHHSGSSHQVAPGQWAGEGQLVGPAGGSWHNSWTWNRAEK
jgi:hypothetical protein